MGIIIVVVNNKGGAGKTSVSTNLSVALANKGKRVLLADLDSQSNATSLILSNQQFTNSFYEVYANDLPVEEAIMETPYHNLFILPNVDDTATLEPTLYQSPVSSFSLLKDKLRQHAIENYDYTIVDCPPNLGLWVTQALVAADAVLVPVLAGSTHSLKGLSRALEAIQAIKEELNPGLRFLRLIINQIDRRNSIHRAMLEKTHKDYSGAIMDTVIPSNTAIQQAEMGGMSVLKYKPSSSGAVAYRGLCTEFIEITHKVYGDE